MFKAIRWETIILIGIIYGLKHRGAHKHGEIVHPRRAQAEVKQHKDHLKRNRRQGKLNPRTLRRKHRLRHQALPHLPRDRLPPPQDRDRVRRLRQTSRKGPEAQRLRRTAD